MPRKILYLINPISGTQGKSSLQQLIARTTEQQRIDFRILPTDAQGDYGYLPSLIREEGFTDIVACGGDGTVNAVASALSGTNIRLGIVPMGSGNGLALAAGIPRHPARALEIIFRGNSSHIDGFTINGRFSCMLCGIGFDAKVAEDFSRQPRRGLQTYIRVTMSSFLRASPYPFILESGGVSFPLDAYFISIANADQFGNNFRIAPRARLDDGLLDIVVVRRTGRFRMLLAVIRQVMGRNALETGPIGANGKKVLYFQTGSLRIGNPARAPLHIDGDPKPSSAEFDIRVLQGAVLLIQP
jgi:YegS/Rv2252/BmrU family lipid kinase